MGTMIEIKNLTKSFKRRNQKGRWKKERFFAVDHISLNIKKGEILGFIGLNGAGKTTALKMLAGLILPDEGNATIDGYDIVKDASILKTKIGFAGEFDRSFYWRLTGRQNLRFFAHLKNIHKAEARINELLDIFNLTESANETSMRYSTGMKHKLVLAIGLLANPDILFLDEPLTGIDPATAVMIKKLMKEKFKNKTIIWASHNLHEIEEMCDRIALIHKGKIVMIGKPEVLKKNYWGYTKILIYSDKLDIFALVPNAKIKKEFVEIRTEDIPESIHKITTVAKKNGVTITDIKIIKPSLEDIFIEVVHNT